VYDSLFPLNSDNRIEYDSVYECQNMSKVDIYNSIQEYIDKKYDKSLEQSSRVNDRESGLISFMVKKDLSFPVRFKTTIKIKDNKYKLTISNVDFDGGKTYVYNRCNGNIAVSQIKCGMDNCNWTFSPKKDWVSFRARIAIYFQDFMADFKKNIVKKSDDW
jgi:hypothetical protein